MKIIFIYFIKGYQLLISPLLGSNCRYSPTCSEYTIQCFDKFPIHKAIWYSMKRISSCHPYSKGGYDPIPGTKIDEELK